MPVLVACNSQSCTDPGDGSRSEARRDEGVIGRSMAATSNAASMCETRPGSIDLAVTGRLEPALRPDLWTGRLPGRLARTLQEIS